MIGLVLALLTGFCLAASFVFLRRGVHISGEISSTIPIFSFVGLLIFGVPVLITGELARLPSITWVGISSLAGAGIVHFILGRISGFTAVRFIGANRAVPIYTFNVIIAVMLGVLFLGEPLTIPLLISILLIFGGIVLITTRGNPEKEQKGAPEHSLAIGVTTAIGAAICWGISPFLVKIGLGEVDSPLLAAFVSYAASSALIGIWLLHPKNSQKLRHVDRSSLKPVIIAAIVMALAHLLRYTSLHYSDLTTVQPLFSTQNLFVFPLSYLINREIETFNLRVILGAITVVTGVFLIFWAG